MKPEVIILTGQSGSGKTTAVRAFEDKGSYVVDNIPTSMVEELIRVVDQQEQYQRLVLVLDARNRRSLQEGPSLVDRLRQSHESVLVVFLEASEGALLRRYSETRRRHPLDNGQGLRDALREERDLLTPLRELADDTFDTTEISPHQLKARLWEMISERKSLGLRVEVMSFGFKHGLPLGADMVLDVRFLPNPYFEPTLRDSTGLDAAVRDFVLETPEATTFLEHAESFLQFLIPQYEAEGKRYFTLAIGCTGGRHRSVTLAITLAERVKEMGHEVAVFHRDTQEHKS